MCALIVRFFNLSSFHDYPEGVQKFHTKPVPRAGGLAIFMACFFVGVAFLFAGKDFSLRYFLFLLSACPAFLAGFFEDITKKVPPRWRLMAAFVSAGIAYFLLDAKIQRLDMFFLDPLVRLSFFSFVFTCFAVAGVSHAFNIIDGFNGLCSGVSAMVFGAYAYVAFMVKDMFLLYLSLVLFFSVFAFFIWNYPFGLIFLGDGGAYFLGFSSAVIGVLLVKQHKVVSAWFPLILVLYPVWETVFSIYRRKFLKSLSPERADALHIHSLIFKRVVKEIFNSRSDTVANPFTSLYLWVLEFLCVAVGVAFWRHTFWLVLFSILFVLIYIWLYNRIVRFKTPQFLFLGRK